MSNPPKFNLGPQDPGPNPLDASTPDVKKALESAKDILILIRDNPRLDHVAAGLGLYLALKQANKSVTVASSTEMRVEFNRLVGVDRIATKIGNRNLVITFPQGIKDSIEKVSYNMDDGNFNLVIQPKPGFPALDSSKVSYSYSGAEAQLVFAIGAQKLEDLGIFYQDDRRLFEQATVVNIDATMTNTRFGQINIIWADFTSACEIVTELIERLGLAFDQDSATNLLAGMNEATQNFQRFNLKATAFEAAAKLMKAGGKRPMGMGGMGAPAFGSSMGGVSPFGSQFGAPSPTGGPRPFAAPGGFASPFANQNSFSASPQTFGSRPPAFPNNFPSPANASAFPPAYPPAQPSLPPRPQPQPTPVPQQLDTTSISPVFSEPPLYPPTLPAPTPPSTANSPSDTAPTQPPPTPSSTSVPPATDSADDWLKPKIFTGSSKIS